jgi:hypothetical protein
LPGAILDSSLLNFKKMETAIYLIRYGVALTMLAYGIHQFINPGQWLHYIPEWLKKILFISPETFMRSHALGNFLIGIWLVSGLWELTGAIVALVWWISVLPFAFRVQWDIGMRDLSIIAALSALIALLRIV